jgi:hypothetical protein
VTRAASLARRQQALGSCRQICSSSWVKRGRESGPLRFLLPDHPSDDPLHPTCSSFPASFGRLFSLATWSIRQGSCPVKKEIQKKDKLNKINQLMKDKWRPGTLWLYLSDSYYIKNYKI